MSEIAKLPHPRLTEQEFKAVWRALELWHLSENDAGNPHLASDLVYGAEVTNYAKQGKVPSAETHRVGNCACANRVASDDRGRGIRFGEAWAEYARIRQSHYAETARESDLW